MSCDVNSTSRKCLDQRLKLRSKRFVVWRYGRDLTVDTKQLIDGHLGRSHRILDCKDDIIGNLDELADESQISRASRHRQGAIAASAGHEHAGDVGHSAWNAVGRFNSFQIKSQMTAEFLQNLSPIALGHRFRYEIADPVRK